MPDDRRYEHFAKVTRRILTWLVVIQLGLGVLSLHLLRQNAERADEAASAADAVCALRHDLQVRVKSSQDYLKAHPNGAPGIPAQAIRQGIANQQQTIRALRRLQCS